MEIHELDRLGDEIAELSAHLEAATAHLLDLIREFDARAGWNTGFRSCAAWLAWRVGLGRPRLARPPGGTRAGRCTCIRTTTAWWSSGGGWRRRSGLCSCRRWPLHARRCISDHARRTRTPGVHP